MNALDRFRVAGVIAALQPRHQTELFFPGQILRLLQLPDAIRINAVRFLDEHMPARRQGGMGVERMKLCRVGDQDHVRRGNDMPVAVESGEAMIILHLHLIRFAVPGQLGGNRPARVVDALQKNVAHGHQPGAGIGAQRLGPRAGVATAAANQPHLQHVAARGMGKAADLQSGQRRGGGGGGRGFEKMAAGQIQMVRRFHKIRLPGGPVVR